VQTIQQTILLTATRHKKTIVDKKRHKFRAFISFLLLPVKLYESIVITSQSGIQQQSAKYYFSDQGQLIRSGAVITI
jgi:hypothetical protein